VKAKASTAETEPRSPARLQERRDCLTEGREQRLAGGCWVPAAAVRGEEREMTLFSKRLKVVFPCQAAVCRAALEHLSADSH